MERGVKKSKYNYEIAAMGGDVISRHYLGDLEMNAGNINRGG